jgi:transposase-like protein
MARYRTYTVEFKRQVVEEHLGGVSLNQLARRHDLSRELLRTWVKKHEAGDLAGGRAATPDRRAYEAKIAGLERKVGQLTMELDLLKRFHGAAIPSRLGTVRRSSTASQRGTDASHHRPVPRAGPAP